MALVCAAASLLVWDRVVKLMAYGNVSNRAQEEKQAEKRIREVLASVDDGEGIRLLLTEARASDRLGMNLDSIEEALRARASALVDGEGGQQVVLEQYALRYNTGRSPASMS
jgi:hypothetical protein